MTNAPQISACPACVAAPSVDSITDAGAKTKDALYLALPGIHCGGCISAVERALLADPGVKSARVNLTLKRASIEVAPTVKPQHLIDVLARAGYEAQELDGAALAATDTDKRSKALLMRLAVAGFAMMNVMLLSVAVWSGATEATRDLFHWLSGAIALPTIAFSAQPFFVNAWSALRVRRLNMDVPISLAIILAAGMSVYETSLGGEHAYFDAALSLTFFLLAGRYLDHRTRSVARSAAEELAALEVPRTLDENGEPVAVADLSVGDRIRVLPGARLPVDGVIISGNSELDRSLLTGESQPVPGGPDTVVSAGEVNLTGPLVVRVTSAGQDTSLRRMANLVAIAESGRNRYTSLADKAAQIYAPLVHTLAFVAFLGWLWASGDARLSMNIAVAVLIITCPCALGLAVPAVATAASGRLFRAGMLVKNATAMERLAEVDTVVFDKTGTLTMGAPELENLRDHSENDLSVARALAEGSGHPLAIALARAAGKADIQQADVTDITEVPGQGVKGLIGGKKVRLGRPGWVGAAPSDVTATYLKIGESAPVAFTFCDALRPGARETVAALNTRGLDVVLLSGDVSGSVADVAERIGISAWEAQMLPEDKAARVAILSGSGRKVLMVGDGLNDTAALASAHASISPASALEAARVVSDMVLLGNSLEPVAKALSVSKSATRRIKENFAIAAMYNAVAIPLALAGFATPLLAALAMSASSISVSLNALRLGRK